jgi:hypothetical protein
MLYQTLNNGVNGNKDVLGVIAKPRVRTIRRAKLLKQLATIICRHPRNTLGRTARVKKIICSKTNAAKEEA